MKKRMLSLHYIFSKVGKLYQLFNFYPNMLILHWLQIIIKTLFFSRVLIFSGENVNKCEFGQDGKHDFFEIILHFCITLKAMSQCHLLLQTSCNLLCRLWLMCLFFSLGACYPSRLCYYLPAYPRPRDLQQK